LPSLIEFALARHPARTFCRIACQASPELAEAGKTALIPITKTSKARTISLILLFSNCVCFALVHLAGSDSAGDLVGVLDVTAVYASAQTKVIIVRYANYSRTFCEIPALISHIIGSPALGETDEEMYLQCVQIQ
jgi:hypothetical protein